MSRVRNREPEAPEKLGSGRRSSPSASGSSWDAPARRGASLTVAFVLSVGLAVAVAAAAAGFLSYALAKDAATDALEEQGRTAALNEAAGAGVRWEAEGPSSSVSGVMIQPARVFRRGAVVPGVVYRAVARDDSGRQQEFDVVADSSMGSFEKSMLISAVFSSFLVVGTGLLVAFILSRRVVAPLTALIEDVRILSHGNLDHRVKVQAGGEVGLLAKSVDRMIRGLRDARDAEREAEQHEHELAIAAEIRSSLLPERVPELRGFEVAAHHAAADSVGGDLFDYVESAGATSSLGVLVASISARGVPGAMLMTMARSYLHQTAEREASPAAALRAANRPITRDMRRGLFVTAMYAVIDGETGRVAVASAGHKAPLLHWVAAEQKLKLLHPEGIALGFDPGPVFERTLREAEVMLAPGDRVVLVTPGAFAVRNQDGAELGEKGFYSLVTKHASKNSEAFCQLVGSQTEKFGEGAPLAEDVVIVTVKRKGVPGGAA